MEINNNNNENINVEIKQNKKKFKDYYQDPSYKKKHNDYMMQKIDCECGCKVMRANMTRHKQTEKHNRLVSIDVDEIVKHYLKNLPNDKLMSYKQLLNETE